MKTCLNCAYIHLKKSEEDDGAHCTVGHWTLAEGSRLPQILSQHKECGDWSLLDILRETRGTKREW